MTNSKLFQSFLSSNSVCCVIPAAAAHSADVSFGKQNGLPAWPETTTEFRVIFTRRCLGAWPEQCHHVNPATWAPTPLLRGAGLSACENTQLLGLGFF